MTDPIRACARRTYIAHTLSDGSHPHRYKCRGAIATEVRLGPGGRGFEQLGGPNCGAVLWWRRLSTQNNGPNMFGFSNQHLRSASTSACIRGGATKKRTWAVCFELCWGLQCKEVNNTNACIPEIGLPNSQHMPLVECVHWDKLPTTSPQGQPIVVFPALVHLPRRCPHPQPHERKLAGRSARSTRVTDMSGGARARAEDELGSASPARKLFWAWARRVPGMWANARQVPRQGARQWLG
eukprot:gene709-biopygen21181